MQERIFAVAGLADQGVLWLLVLLAVVSIGLIFERWATLKPVIKQSLFHRQQITQAVKERNLSVVEDIAANTGSIEGRAVGLALEQARSGHHEGLSEIFSTVAQLERSQLERSLGFLATVGSNAPYIGLFGTVLGIMKAFNDMSQTVNANQQSVMAGISAALIATAAGLLVAIPAVLAFNFFQRQVKLVMGSLDSCRDLVLAWSKQQGVQNGREK
ncbi:MAG: MotA/TolQ/ExbB proton channel family protein [Bdellovibrionales bacterium]